MSSDNIKYAPIGIPSYWWEKLQVDKNETWLQYSLLDPDPPPYLRLYVQSNDCYFCSDDQPSYGGVVSGEIITGQLNNIFYPDGDCPYTD